MIAAMVENMVEVLEYQNYIVFVGTYVNDPATIDEVERMAQALPRRCTAWRCRTRARRRKADCLNFVVADDLRRTSGRTGIEFAGVVLHDSEDVLHPLELKFFNYLLPRKDMIQLPVASLEREWYELVAGTYMDEFAESHAKEMVVRESVVGHGAFGRRGHLLLAQGAGGAGGPHAQQAVQHRQPDRRLRRRHAPVAARHAVDLRRVPGHLPGAPHRLVRSGKRRASC